MAVTDETLRGIIRDYQGFELDDEELKLVRLELDNYLAEVEKLRELDLSSVISARLLKAEEGGEP